MTAIAPAGRDVELLRAFVDRIDQHDPGAFNNLGVLFFSKGLLTEAVDAFLRALTIDPRMRTAGRNLEIVASEPGACAAHLARLDEVVARNSGDAESQRQRARLLRLIGRHHDASQALDALIRDNPDDGVALFERGLIEQRNGDLRRAQRWFERAVGADSADPIPRLHLAETLYQRGQNEQSLETLDVLLGMAPMLADAHLLRGFVLGDMGQHEAGLAAGRQASAINPGLGTLQPDLSIDAIIGASNGVAGVSHAVMGVAPDSGMARYGLGLAFRQRGYFPEARREFLRAIENGEDARPSRHAMAELDLVIGDHESASTAYAGLIAERPDEARYWNEHGVSLHQRGDLTVAAGSYRRALQCEPRYAVAYNNLGVALAGQGDG
ncbi:MAG: tetratricopeptide repeat protein, partial [Gemmatimonas sp.]